MLITKSKREQISWSPARQEYFLPHAWMRSGSAKIQTIQCGDRRPDTIIKTKKNFHVGYINDTTQEKPLTITKRGKCGTL